MALRYEIKDEKGNVETEILIEPVELAVQKGVIIQDVGLVKKVKELPKEAFDKVFTVIPFISKKLVEHIEQTKVNKPSEVECEFSIGLGLEGNLILVKGKADTQFKVKMIWKNIQRLRNTQKNSSIQVKFK